MSSADIQKLATCFNFLNYLVFTYFILLQSEMTEMTRFPRHWSIPQSIIDKAVYQRTVRLAFHRASSTRPLINGQYDCVHAQSIIDKAVDQRTVRLAFHRASSTRPLINGQYDCVHAWRWKGIISNICCKQPVLFRATHSQLKKTRWTLRIWHKVVYKVVWAHKNIGKLKTLYTFNSWMSHL